MQYVIGFILSVMIGGFVFFRLYDKWLRYKEKEAGKSYCELNGLNYLGAKTYELHTRLYFEKDGVKSWANFETDKNNRISWLKESPLQKIELIKSRSVIKA